jgi:hypothetical protein
MLGAFLLLLLFLAVNQESARFLGNLHEEMQSRFHGQEPVSDVAAILMMAAAVAATLLMLVRSRNREATRYIIVRRQIHTLNPYSFHASGIRWHLARLLGWLTVCARRLRAHVGWAR